MGTSEYFPLKHVEWSTLPHAKYSHVQLRNANQLEEMGIQPLGVYQEKGRYRKNPTLMYAFQYNGAIVSGILKRGIVSGTSVFLVNIQIGDTYFDIMMNA